jgi:hypothetical protein
MSSLNHETPGVKPDGAATSFRGNPSQDILRIPTPGPIPITWIVRFRTALAEGDRTLEKLARTELRRIGWYVGVSRQWRKGGRP